MTLQTRKTPRGNAPRTKGPVLPIAADGTLFIPFGSYAEPNGLHVFNIEAAKQLAAAAHRKTYPVNIGYPLLTGSGDTDGAAYGWIQGVRITTTGVALPVKWGGEGRRMIANDAFRYFAPLWQAERSGKTFRPLALMACGLTNIIHESIAAAGNSDDPAGLQARRQARRQHVAEVGNELRSKLPHLSQTELAQRAWSRCRQRFPNLFSH
jgi:phage I-like protein